MSKADEIIEFIELYMSFSQFLHNNVISIKLDCARNLPEYNDYFRLRDSTPLPLHFVNRDDEIKEELKNRHCIISDFKEVFKGEDEYGHTFSIKYFPKEDVYIRMNEFDETIKQVFPKQKKVKDYADIRESE